MEGLWNDYEEKNEEFDKPYDRGPITSELEVSDKGLEKIEKELGFSIDDAFDTYKDGQNSDIVGGTTHAAAGTENGKVVLEAFRDAPLSSLAHESVHGMIEHPDTEPELPDSDPWDQTLYEEFVARKAESVFEDIEVSELELRGLSSSRKAYEQAREEYKDFLPDEELDLNQQIKHIEAIEDPEINEELYTKADAYRDNRNTVLASEAARRYQEETDISELINPDRKTYQDALEHIKNVDDQIFNEY